jgi:hypothetical protein
VARSPTVPLKDASLDIRPNWWAVLGVCGLFLASGIGCVVVLTRQALSADGQDPLPGGWSWPGVLLADALMIGAFLWLCWIVLRQALTRFTTEGVTQPRVFGHTHIAWSDVEWVAPRVTIASAKARITVTPEVFRQPQRFLSEVADRVPKRARIAKQ